MASIEAYFDESGSHSGSPFLCVAGYVFDADSCLLLDREWGEMLAAYHLPYFRMSDCAPDPGNGPFKNLSKQQRIDVAARAIQIIKKHMSYGFALSLDMRFAHMLHSGGATIALIPISAGTRYME